MTEDRTPGQTIDINYIKSPGFREIACDGILGGPTPRGLLWMAFYTDRFPLPRISRHPLIKLGDETFTIDQSKSEMLDGRQGIVRNIEVGAYLTIETAKELHSWLGKQIEAMTSEKGK